jgi:hypothetical protein
MVAALQSDHHRFVANEPTNRFAADEHTIALFHFDESPGAFEFMDASPSAFVLAGQNGATIAEFAGPGEPLPPRLLPIPWNHSL